MTGGSQRQAGSDGSVQFQAGRDLVVGDIPEGVAREIIESTARVVAESFEQGQAVALARMQQFENRVMESFARNNTLGTLADPAVQTTLRKAQMGAATTERESDYDILSELLNERVQRASDRPTRAGINRATEVVAELDVGALRGLTLMHAVTGWRPTHGDPSVGIKTMSDVAALLLADGELPTGSGWTEHLDILDAVRVSSGQSFRPFAQYWPMLTPGYVSVGIPMDHQYDGADPSLATPYERLRKSELCVEHIYKPGFFRLNVPSLQSLKKVCDDELLKVAEEIFRVGSVDDAASEAYMQDVLAEESLEQVAAWWSALPGHFSLTSVGRVIASANARRLNPALPAWVAS